MTAAATPRLSLYDLGEAQDILDSFLLEQEGEETPDIAELWDMLSGQIDEKVERFGLWLRGQQLQAELIKGEEERLRQRRKVLENGIERGKATLQANMERLGHTKVAGKLLTVSITLNPPSVKGELDEGTLRNLIMIEPEMVKHIPEQWVLVKDAVKAAHKAGKLLPTGLTVEQSSSLRIR